MKLNPFIVVSIVLALAFALNACSSSKPAANSSADWNALSSALGDQAKHECIVLALGGNKLCGQDAAAWCKSTDSIRADAQPGDPDYDSKQSCQALEQALGY
jgi:hypothetical protein